MARFPIKRTMASLVAAFAFVAMAGGAPSHDQALQSTPGPQMAQALKDSFNRKAIGRSYYESCRAKTDDRADNVRNAIQWSTPHYFRKHGDKMIYYSPLLTDQEKREAEKMVKSLPPHIMDLFYARGGVFVFPSHSLIEALPGYKGTKVDGAYPYYNVYVGLYRSGEKRVFVPFYTAEVTEGKNGPEITRFAPISNKMRVFNHEVGHFIDDVIGEMGASFFEFGSKNFSDRDEYVQRMTADLDDLVSSHRSEWELRWRSYFLPKEYKGHELFGQKDSANDIRAEVFAELWAEAQGHGILNLKSFFPRTFELVKGLDLDLQKLYAAKGHRCNYPINDPKIKAP